MYIQVTNSLQVQVSESSFEQKVLCFPVPGQSLAQEKLWGRKGVEASSHTYPRAWGRRRARPMQLEARSHLALTVVSVYPALTDLAAPIARVVCTPVLATAD